MKSIKFVGANLELAKDQPQYDTLHIYLEMKTIKTLDGETKEVPWQMTACFEFTDEEIEEIIKNRKIYYTQCLFGKQFHPMGLELNNPVIPILNDE